MKTTGLMAAVAAGLFALLGATADAAEPAPGQGARIRERLRGRVRERLVEKFDKDGDGKVGPEERAAARDEIVEKIFAKHDADGDGKLSKDEFRAALAALRERLQQRLQGRQGAGPGNRL